MRTVDKLRQLYPTLTALEQAKAGHSSWRKLAQSLGCNAASLTQYHQKLREREFPPEQKVRELFPTCEDFEHYLAKHGSEMVMGNLFGLPTKYIRQRRIELFGDGRPKKAEITNPNDKPVSVYHITDMAAFNNDEIGSYDHLEFARYEKPRSYSQIYGFNGRVQDYE